MPGPPAVGRFPTTSWGRVARSGDPDAMAVLCSAYWYPIYALIRRKGHNEQDALDLTQSYFARLLEKGVLSAANPEKGRFRAFLRTDCGFFLADQGDRERAGKRGGGITPVSIDALDAEGRYRVEPAETLTPERLFDRAWAATLLDGAVEEIRAEYEESGRGDLFERLKAALTEGPRSIPYAAIAQGIGTTEVAVQSAVQRLRRRFRELVREKIAGTLDDPSPADVEDEIRALFAALG